ncbi:hypothetical protein J3B02_000620 [Coemansia erecta]|nr:hypothetical protein J3B02_000620 [Coemansia erecta]
MSTTNSSASSVNSLSIENDKTKWNFMQVRLRDSIVAIQCTAAHCFDTDEAGCSNATGFVVDADLGIIVSNRHVMGSGPSYHKGVFFNNTEIFLQPCFYDPINDFSIFRYDPAELKTFKPRAIPLCPERATSGMEFRVVGNNANEKMSVHPGELSQTDRNVPDYGSGYNDYNTFYIQASTTSNGGSSGSPVVNIDGEAVALMAGGATSASSCFFLPLHRVVYALGFIKRNEIPPRGTIQAIFMHITHREAERRDLSREIAIENGVDVDSTTGVLSVEKILPSGPADGKLKIGDIVISIDKRPIAGFVEMADLIDSSVGSNVCFHVFRNNKFVDVEVSVQDLYSITPSKILRVAGAYFHDMSFQLAARNSVPVTGVYPTAYCDSFMPFSQFDSCRIIESINGTPTPNLDAMIEVFNKLTRGQQMVLKLRSQDAVRDENFQIAKSPLVSLPDTIFTRSKASGFWSAEPYNGFLEADKPSIVDKETDKSLVKMAIQKPIAQISKKISEKMASGKIKLTEAFSNTAKSVIGHKDMTQHKSEKLARKQNQIDMDISSKLKKVAQCVVSIKIASISFADGSTSVAKYGSGLVVSKDYGIIICSTSLVSNPTCEIAVSFQGKAEIQATLAYSHPLYPISFLKYNPALLKQEAADLSISNLDLKNVNSADRLAVGSPITVLYYNKVGRLLVTPSSVMSRSTLDVRGCTCCTIPGYYNVDYFNVSTLPESDPTCIGVVCNSRGKVRGLWANITSCEEKNESISCGLDISVITQTIETLTSGKLENFEKLSVLNVTFSKYNLPEAKVFGISDRHFNALYQCLPKGSQNVFVVQNILQKMTNDIPSLHVGDLVLRINGRFVLRLDQLSSFYDQKTVELTVIRDQKEITFITPTMLLPTRNTRRVVCWAGIIMQEPWLPIQQRSASVPSQVFSFIESAGSPAARATPFISYYITEINNTAVKTLDDVARIAKQLKSKDADAFNARVANNEHFISGEMPGCDVKVRVVSISGEERVISIRTNDHYFPAWQLVRGPSIEDKWKMEIL